MSEDVKRYDSWEYVILDFFEFKVPNIKSGQKCKLFSARKYIEDKNADINTEKDEKKRHGAIIRKENKEQERIQLIQDAPSGEIRQWIDITSKKTIGLGKRIIKSTHVLKFTHGSSEAAGIILREKSNDLQLTTASFKKQLTMDLAHNNGALITISRFLALSLHEKQIFDLVFDGDFDFLKPFSQNKQQLDQWQEGFENLVEQRKLTTADKAKQTYFPLKERTTEEYHLIAPLFASSLCNEIDTKITYIKYGEEQKEINKCKKGGKDKKEPKYHPSFEFTFPNLAVLNFDKKHPNNISMLNADRRGKLFLFSTQPPTWKSQLKPPLYKNSLFDNISNSHITEDIDYLQEFLLRFDRIELSIKDPKRLKWIHQWVNSIVDEVLFYIASIQNLPSGWSATENIKLKAEHQYFLDPYRDEKSFQDRSESTDWQKIVCSDFARWLNRRLVGREKQFTPQAEHSRIWQQLFEQPLRENSETIKAELKLHKQEAKA